MKLEFFKPSDFYLTDAEIVALEANTYFYAKRANAKLNEALGKKIYGDVNNGMYSEDQDPTSDTHTAYLFNIQPIKECEHKNFRFETGVITLIFCQDCNKQLEPTGWRIKE